MKLVILGVLARLFGIQFKVDGIPYGATKTDPLRSTSQRICSAATPTREQQGE